MSKARANRVWRGVIDDLSSYSLHSLLPNDDGDGAAMNEEMLYERSRIDIFILFSSEKSTN